MTRTRLEDFVRLGLSMRRIALDWTWSRKQSNTSEVREGRIWDLHIVSRCEDEKDPRPLERKLSF